MGFEIDLFSVLRAIGSNRDVFQDVCGDVTKTVPALIEKQLKAIGSDLNRLRQIKTALGSASFDAIVERLGGQKMHAIVKKLDKHNPRLKDKDKDKTWAVAHVKSLATDAEPMTAPVRGASARRESSTATPSEVVGTLASKAMGAKRRPS